MDTFETDTESDNFFGKSTPMLPHRIHFSVAVVFAALLVLGCEEGPRAGRSINGAPDGVVEYLKVSESGEVEHQEGQFLALVQRNDQRLVLVDFGATWCGPCRMLAPNLSKIKKSWGDDVEVVTVDVDKSRELAAHLGVSSVPDVRIFRNGTQVGGFVGAIPREDIESMLKSLK